MVDDAALVVCGPNQNGQIVEECLVCQTRNERHTAIIAGSHATGKLLETVKLPATRTRAGLQDLRQVAAAHHIERARMSSPLAAVRLSIASDGNSSTVEPSVDTSSPLRRHVSWMVSA